MLNDTRKICTGCHRWMGKNAPTEAYCLTCERLWSILRSRHISPDYCQGIIQDIWQWHVRLIRQARELDSVMSAAVQAAREKS